MDTDAQAFRMADSDPATSTGKRVQRRRTGREIIKQFLQRTFSAVVLTIAVVYLCDYLLLRFRIATNRQPYGDGNRSPVLRRTAEEP